MPDDGSKQSTNIWPLPKFYFTVDFGDGFGAASFQEVSGLSSETKVIDYRHGDSKVFSTIKMPGIAKSGNVTLKKGIFQKDGAFWKWHSELGMGTIKRRDVVVSLVDEAGKPMMSWTLHNAFPVKLTVTDLKSDGNEVAVETIELAFETMDVKNA